MYSDTETEQTEQAVQNDVSVGDFSEEQSSTNIGFQILEDLLKQGVLHEESKAFHENKYRLLHETVTHVIQSESMQLQKAKKLNQEAITGRERREHMDAQRAEELLERTDLKRENTKVENQLAIAMENLSVCQTTEVELERKKALLESAVVEMGEKKDEEERPIIEQLEREVEELKREIRKNGEMYNKKMRERQKALELLESSNQYLQEQSAMHGNLNLCCKEIETEPLKARKMTKQSNEALAGANRTAEELEKRLSNTTNIGKKREVQLNELNENTKDLQQLTLKLELQDIPTVEKKITVLQQDIDAKRESFMEHQVEKQSNEVELQSKDASFRDAYKNLTDIKKELEEKQTQLSRKKKQLETLQTNRTLLEEDVENRNTEMMSLQMRIEEEQGRLKDMMKSNDQAIYNFFNTEKVGDALYQEMQQRRIEMQVLESQTQEMAAEEKANNAKILMLSLEKERCARESSTNKRLFVEAMNEVKVKTFVNREMLKNVKEIRETRKAKQALYSATKAERNRLVKYLRESEQTLVQIRANDKVLENELEVLTKQDVKLRNDIGLKERELHEETNVITKLKTRRVRIKQECDGNTEVESEKQMEIRKLNSVINHMENDMLQLKKDYENVVHDRNFTGIQVIDRNDELAILYEKTNVQEEIIKRGDQELTNRDDEINTLTLEIESLERQISFQNKQIPDYKALKKERLVLIENMSELEKNVTELSDALENPQNLNRWRNLDTQNDGFLPGESNESLREKVQELDENINMRNEQLMEKNLLLREITDRSDEARRVAIEHRNKTFNFAANVNKLKDRIKKTNSKMMATLSELSVYQATSLNYEERNKELQEYIEHCMQRFEEGLPPSEEIQREWEQRQILEQKRLAEMISLQERKAQNYDLPPTVTRTMAFQRPTSYIPNDEFGIPKPYSGAFQPFMFSEPGANMRHYKKPETKDIVV